MGWTGAFLIYSRAPEPSFEQKEVCAQYVDRWKERASTVALSYVVSVSGFFSPSRTTCIIETKVTFRDGAIHLTVKDALTEETLLSYASPTLQLNEEEQAQDARAFAEYTTYVAKLRGE
jgi:hypothetical protein